MEYIEKDYLDEFNSRSFQRADDFYAYHYTKIDLFNQCKDILLSAGVTKPTWYTLIAKIEEKSIKSSDQFEWTTMPLNLVRMAFEVFRDSGEIIDVEDLRNILYTYEDYIPHHLEYAVHEHFAIQDFVTELYRLKSSQRLMEILCLSDFLILKMCPRELMSAKILTLESMIKVCKQNDDQEGIIIISDFGMALLDNSSVTYQYCKNARERAMKKLQIK